MKRTVRSWNNGVLRSAVDEFCKQFQESLLLTPNTVQPAIAASLGMHRLTLPQLVRQLAQVPMAQAGLAPLTPLASEAIAARVVFRAREERNTAYFTPVAHLPGFSRALARTIRDLRLAGTRPEALANGAAPARDLGLLLTAYEQELDERALIDTAGELALAAQVTEHRWRGLPIAVLDVALPSRAHRDFLESFLKSSPHTLVATLGTSDAPIESALDHLRANLFESASVAYTGPVDAFEFFSAPGEGLEAIEIARRIHTLARTGVRFDQVAILLRNPDRYQPMVEEALRRADIPAYFTRGSARPDAAGRAFLALLGCAADNLSASRFAEYMSLGQIPPSPSALEWVPSESEASEPAPEAPLPTPRRWEQYLVDAAVIGGRDRWERRLRGLEAEWELNAADNSARLQQLRNLRTFALPLIDKLAALPRHASWREWLAALRTLAVHSLRAPDAVLATLTEFEPMSDVGPATLEEVIEVLTERLRFLRPEPSGRPWGRVFVGSIDEARGRDFRVVFLPGLAEGLFPQRLSEDPLLLDEYRAAVDAHLPRKEGRIDEERERLHLAIAAAREKLIASYPRMEVAEARPRVPSFYALELPRALHGAVPELEVFEKQARNAAPARLNWPAPALSVEAIDDTEYDLTSIATGSARHVLEVNAHAARSLRARFRRWQAKWYVADGLLVHDGAALAAMQTQRLTARAWSASALETFATCPYKFALRGIFHLRAREDSAALEQMDPATRGSLFHEVQRRLYLDLEAAGALPVTSATLVTASAALERVLDETAAAYAERLAPAIPRVWNSEIDSLRSDLRGWLRYTSENEYEWTPTDFELSFEEDLSHLVKLHGRIDAVESKGDVRRVIDYKTGRPPEMIPKWVGGGKHLQPLLYAMAAEQKLGGTVEAGRLLYATQRGNYTPVEIRLDERARQFLAKLLSNIDTMIGGGFLPPVPDKDACQICDYRVVCGPYEERRTTVKDRNDERLDGLIEIRGMA